MAQTTKLKKATTRPCSRCGLAIDWEAAECPNCHEDLVRRCVVCAGKLHLKARFCNACDSYQAWFRRTFHLSNAVVPLLTALVTSTTVLITIASAFTNRNSQTSVSFLGAASPLIYVYVSNTGRSLSLMRTYTLHFGEDVPIDDATLQLLNQDKSAGLSVVQGGGNARIGLVVEGLSPRFRDATHTKKYEWSEIESAIDHGGKATVVIVVKESNGEFTRSDSFDAKLIKQVIEDKLGKSKPVRLP